MPIVFAPPRAQRVVHPPSPHMHDSRDASRQGASYLPASNSPDEPTFNPNEPTEKLRHWRAALHAAGFRTNLSLARPASLAARPSIATDDGGLRWVTILASGAVALERSGRGPCSQSWSLVSAGQPTAEDIVEATRTLLIDELPDPSVAPPLRDAPTAESAGWA